MVSSGSQIGSLRQGSYVLRPAIPIFEEETEVRKPQETQSPRNAVSPVTSPRRPSIMNTFNNTNPSSIDGGSPSTSPRSAEASRSKLDAGRPELSARKPPPTPISRFGHPDLTSPRQPRPTAPPRPITWANTRSPAVPIIQPRVRRVQV